MTSLLRIARLAGIAVALCCAVAGLVTLTGCSAQPLLAEDPLSASPPAEAVLRTLHLAGVTSAVVGEQGRVATAYIRLPAADSAADVEAGWLTALSALRAAYAKASGYRVMLVGPADEPLVELSWTGRAARDAESAEQLRSGARVTYPSSIDRPAGDALLDSADVNAGYLADKNAAAGVSAEGAREEFSTVSRQLPGRPAPGPGESAAVVTAQRIAELLADATEPTAVALRDAAVATTAEGTGSDDVLALRRRLSAVEAMSMQPDGEEALLNATDDLARSVVAREVEQSGPRADALLATARSDRAPADAVQVALFEREVSLDTSATGDGGSVPNLVIAALSAQGGSEPAVTWSGGSVRPQEWLAYRRADGRLFWLAGDDGPVALTDRTVAGFAWQTPVAALVRADDVGDVLARLALP